MGARSGRGDQRLRLREPVYCSSQHLAQAAERQRRALGPQSPISDNSHRHEPANHATAGPTVSLRLCRRPYREEAWMRAFLPTTIGNARPSPKGLQCAQSKAVNAFGDGVSGGRGVGTSVHGGLDLRMTFDRRYRTAGGPPSQVGKIKCRPAASGHEPWLRSTVASPPYPRYRVSRGRPHRGQTRHREDSPHPRPRRHLVRARGGDG